MFPGSLMRKLYRKKITEITGYVPVVPELHRKNDEQDNQKNANTTINLSLTEHGMQWW